MSGISDKIKGKAKQAEGKVTGNRARVAEGKAQEIKGDVERMVDRADKKAQEGLNRAKERMRSKR